MNQNQIEEMARDICLFAQEYETCEKCDTDLDIGDEICTYKCMANLLIQRGYRKVEQGEWKRQKKEIPTSPEAICSKCGREVVYQIIDNRWQFENYCPHCGREMEGAE